MTIGERLLKLRKEKNLSQEELANILNVSRQTISKWETDQSTPDFDKIVPLCNYYGITTDELLTGSKDMVEKKKDDKRGKFAKNLAIAIGLYISSIVLIIFFSEFDNEILGVCFFFIINAIATGLIVYNGIVNGQGKDKEKKVDKKKDRTLKLVCETIDLIGLIAYFIVSFTTGAWHISWIIFIIIALCETIAKLLFGLKEEKTETKEVEENE